MTKVIKVSTGSAFENKVSYSRAVAIDDWIYVSLTAGRDPATNEMSDDVVRQTYQVFANIDHALGCVDATLGDVIFSRVFIPNPDDVPKVLEILGEKFRGINPATTICCAPLAADIYKVEIEVTAFKGAAKHPVENIKVTL